MRIALITPYFSPDTNSGIGRYVEDLAIGLSNKNHEVEVIALGNKHYVETSRNGFLVHWILNVNLSKPNYLPFLHLLFGSYKCRKILIEKHKKKPYDIIEYPNTGVTGLFSLLLKFPEPRPRFIVRLSSPRAIFKKHFIFFRITEFLEAFQARISDAVIAVSQANYSLCLANYQFSSDIPNCTILHSLPQETKAFSVNPHSKSDKILRVFFLGRMEDRKGFDVLTKAWPLVVVAVPKVKLIVAGEDSPHNGDSSYFAWAIRNISSEICKQIEYLGAVNDELRESLYQQCDVCVIPSRYESFGLISLEAMRYGKPVVSTDVGGIPEVVTHGVTGLLVPVEDHEMLAGALIKLLQDEKLREQFGRNALTDVKIRFSPERVVTETESFYLSLMR